MPVVAPAAIAIEAGTVRSALLSDKDTRLPPAGATLLKVTVQVLVPSDTRAVGVQSKDDS